MENGMNSTITACVGAFALIVGLGAGAVSLGGLPAHAHSEGAKPTTAAGQGMQSQGMQGQGMGATTVQPMPGMPSMRRPEMNAAKGRTLFVTKGCVACHSINGIGGHDAAKLDASTMDEMMNPFDFAAKMWMMAPAMIAAQEDELGGQILFTGDELSDIVAFVHDPEEQKKFSEADLTPEARRMMGEHHHEGIEEKDHHDDQPRRRMGGNGDR